jgi:hypothetical protein
MHDNGVDDYYVCFVEDISDLEAKETPAGTDAAAASASAPAAASQPAPATQAAPAPAPAAAPAPAPAAEPAPAKTS